jgi:hypothetical protein
VGLYKEKARAEERSLSTSKINIKIYKNLENCLNKNKERVF